MEAINGYDGPGYVQGAAPGQRRKTSIQSIRESHRELMAAMEKNGKMALNAADFERTMHLPVGGGRLACDEDGEFDKGAHRPPARLTRFPMHLHSTITVGEYVEVRNESDLGEKLATGKWAVRPQEIVKRFRLTETDQMLALQAEIQGERAARLAIERQMGLRPDAGFVDPVTADKLLTIEVARLKEENRVLADRFELLMARLDSNGGIQAPAKDADKGDADDSDDEYKAEPAGKKRK